MGRPGWPWPCTQGLTPLGRRPSGRRAPGPEAGELGRGQMPTSRHRGEAAGDPAGYCPPPTPQPGFRPCPPSAAYRGCQAGRGQGGGSTGGGRPHATWPSAQQPLQPGSDGTLPAGRQLPGPGLQSTEEAHGEVETRPSHPAAGDEQNSEGASPPTAPWPPTTQDNRGPSGPLLTPAHCTSAAP